MVDGQEKSPGIKRKPGDISPNREKTNPADDGIFLFVKESDSEKFIFILTEMGCTEYRDDELVGTSRKFVPENGAARAILHKVFYKLYGHHHGNGDELP